MTKIGILCSGGDSQGMNACIQSVVNMANVHNMQVVGFYDGYQGLIEDRSVVLTTADVKNIGHLGGSFLRVSRCPEFRTAQGVQKGVDVCNKNQLDCLIVIGGDGSYRGAIELMKLGIKIYAIPGTIDNDLFYTDRTLGFDTAVNNAVSAIDNIRQTMEANDRALVVEVMGRECGHIGLHVAVATCANSLAVKEVPVTIDNIVEDVRHCMNNGVKSPVVVISEAVDYSVDDVKNALQQELGISARSSVIGYLQRGGAPSVTDRTLAVQYGINAIELMYKKVYNVALGVRNKNVFYMDLQEVYNIKDEFNLLLYKQLKNLHNL